MTKQRKLYLMHDTEQDYGMFAWGEDPANAVEAHHSLMNAWCAPVHDEDYYEEYCTTLYEMPRAIEDGVEAHFKHVVGGQFADAIAALALQYPEIIPMQVNVICTADGRTKASLMPLTPSLLGGAIGG